MALRGTLLSTWRQTVRKRFRAYRLRPGSGWMSHTVSRCLLLVQIHTEIKRYAFLLANYYYYYYSCYYYQMSGTSFIVKKNVTVAEMLKCKKMELTSPK